MYAERQFLDDSSIVTAASILAETCDKVEYSLDGVSESAASTGELLTSVPYTECAWASFVRGRVPVASLAQGEGLLVYEAGPWDARLDQVHPQERNEWSWINLDVEDDSGTNITADPIAQAFAEVLKRRTSARALGDYLDPLDVASVHIAAVEATEPKTEMSRTGGVLVITRTFREDLLGESYIATWWEELINEIGSRYLAGRGPNLPWLKHDEARITVKARHRGPISDACLEEVLQVLSIDDVELDGWERLGDDVAIPVAGSNAKHAIKILISEADRLQLDVVDTWPWKSLCS